MCSTSGFKLKCKTYRGVENFRKRIDIQQTRRLFHIYKHQTNILTITPLHKSLHKNIIHKYLELLPGPVVPVAGGICKPIMQFAAMHSTTARRAAPGPGPLHAAAPAANTNHPELSWQLIISLLEQAAGMHRPQCLQSPDTHH